MRRRLAAAAAIALAVAAGWIARGERTVPRKTIDAGAPETPAPAQPRALAIDIDRIPDAPPPAADTLATTSLRGTEPDGAIAFDAAGQVVLDAALVRVFDYFLALTGEVSDARIRSLLFEHAVARHGQAAALRVLAVFDRYVAMRAELAAQPPTADLDRRYARLRETRERWFGAAAEAMFGAEHAQLEDTLTRRHLADDPDALAEFEAARPPARRAAEREAAAAHIAEEQTRQLDALDTDPEQRRAEREQLWGAEAAARLAALDAQRADWDRRVADYLRRRETVGAAEALRGFTAEERARIEALEAVGALRRP